MSVNDPTQPSLTDALLPLVTPVVQQAWQSASVDLQTRLSALEAQAAAAASGTITQLEPNVLVAGASILSNVEHDVVTQRVIVWAVVGTVLALALAVVTFAMLGNATANKWIGAAPTAVVGVVLWVSNAGAILPKRTPSQASDPAVTQ